MPSLEDLPRELVENVVRRLPVAYRADWFTCARVVAGVTPGPIVRGISIDLDDLDLIAQLPRGERLKKLVSVRRLTLVGRGSVERYQVDSDLADHRFLQTMLLLSRHVHLMPHLVLLELSSVPAEAVLAAAGCLSLSCPTLSHMTIREVTFSTTNAVSMLCAMLGDLPRLRGLGLYGCKLPGDLAFPRLPQLRHLCLVDNESDPGSDYGIGVSIRLLNGLTKVCELVWCRPCLLLLGTERTDVCHH